MSFDPLAMARGGVGYAPPLFVFEGWFPAPSAQPSGQALQVVMTTWDAYGMDAYVRARRRLEAEIDEETIGILVAGVLN